MHGLLRPFIRRQKQFKPVSQIISLGVLEGWGHVKDYPDRLHKDASAVGLKGFIQPSLALCIYFTFLKALIFPFLSRKTFWYVLEPAASFGWPTETGWPQGRAGRGAPRRKSFRLQKSAWNTQIGQGLIMKRVTLEAMVKITCLF